MECAPEASFHDPPLNRVNERWSRSRGSLSAASAPAITETLLTWTLSTLSGKWLASGCSSDFWGNCFFLVVQRLPILVWGARISAGAPARNEQPPTTLNSPRGNP